MPIAIVGAGRSGTSMLARMLDYCGLSLGEDADFEPADEHNPLGYWEHSGIFDINERLTAFLGGSTYDEPPLLTPGWQMSLALDPFYEEARATVEKSFGGNSQWVWKLPQASVTIPFWRRVVPDLRFIVCIRNPLDYVSSIKRAHGVSKRHALSLWALYNIAVLRDTCPSERFVTAFEEYFPDYRAGLRPVLEFAGLQAPDSEADRLIQRFHDPNPRHAGSTFLDLLTDPDAPHIVKELYLQMIQSTRNAEGVIAAVRGEESVELLQMMVASEAKALREMRGRERIEAERDHLKQILGSRTHRAASSFCAALIKLKHVGKPRLSPVDASGSGPPPGIVRTKTSVTPASGHSAFWADATVRDAGADDSGPDNGSRLSVELDLQSGSVREK